LAGGFGFGEGFGHVHGSSSMSSAESFRLFLRRIAIVRDSGIQRPLTMKTTSAMIPRITRSVIRLIPIAQAYTIRDGQVQVETYVLHFL
jgi:hypothetical protein